MRKVLRYAQPWQLKITKYGEDELLILVLGDTSDAPSARCTFCNGEGLEPCPHLLDCEKVVLKHGDVLH